MRKATKTSRKKPSARKTEPEASAARKKAQPRRKAPVSPARQAAAAPPKPAAMLDDDALAKVRAANVANIIRKAKAGKVLTRAEQRMLEENTRGGASAEPEAEANRVWLTPAELHVWLIEQGVRISRKNLYGTYLGKAARYPLERTADGQRIHKWKALELIKTVQQREDLGDRDGIIARRQLAEARIREARAEQEALRLAEMKKSLVPAELVRRIWTRAIESFKNELRTLIHALPRDLEGRTQAQMREIIESRHLDALRHLSAGFLTPKAKA